MINQISDVDLNKKKVKKNNMNQMMPLKIKDNK